jgi:hypothetical protein
MSLDNSVISNFGDPELLAVNRDDQPQRVVNGRIMPGSTTQLEVTAAVQPLRGMEIMMFPETDRVRQSYKVYSTDPLLIGSVKGKTKSDVVTYQDNAFEVVSVERWVLDDFVYYKSIMRRIDDK